MNKTAPLLHRSLVALEAIAAAGGKVLFVATKHQAKDIVKDAAERCGQYYVNNRWLGGMLTNWTTVSQSIRRLKKMEADIENAEKLGLTKKEVGVMTKEVEKLRDIFGGILDMHGVPQAMVVIDVPREMNAVREAKNLDGDFNSCSAECNSRHGQFYESVKYYELSVLELRAINQRRSSPNRRHHHQQSRFFPPLLFFLPLRP